MRRKPGLPHTIARGSAYCMADDCDQFGKSVFVMGDVSRPVCHACHRIMRVEPEHCKVDGDSPVYREVRVEFQYDPLKRRYRSLAIVRADTIWKGSTYTLYTPLIQTEKRALALAEQLLGALLMSGTVDPDYRQTVLDFDAPRQEWIESLARLSRRLSPLP